VARPSRGSSNRTDEEIGTIRYPVRSEDWFALRHADWQRIRGRVAELTNPLPYIGQVGWASVGIGGGAFLALLPWTAAYSQLLGHAQNHYAWITPALTIIGVAAFVVAGMCLFANRKIRERDRATVASVLSDMDNVYQQCEQQDKPTSPDNGAGSSRLPVPRSSEPSPSGIAPAWPDPSSNQGTGAVVGTISPSTTGVDAPKSEGHPNRPSSRGGSISYGCGSSGVMQCEAF
jgi:hypothetical protein